MARVPAGGMSALYMEHPENVTMQLYKFHAILEFTQSRDRVT